MNNKPQTKFGVLRLLMAKLHVLTEGLLNKTEVTTKQIEWVIQVRFRVAKFDPYAQIVCDSELNLLILTRASLSDVQTALKPYEDYYFNCHQNQHLYVLERTDEVENGVTKIVKIVSVEG